MKCYPTDDIQRDHNKEYQPRDGKIGMRKIEMKALKAILKVKKGTANDLILHELRRPDIISKIKDLQFQFFSKPMNTSIDKATVRAAIEICKGSRYIKYYLGLTDI